MARFTRESPEVGATRALGASLARALRPGDVVALEGELGAGKTTLVRAIASGLGVEPGLVSSPTFVFINQYPAASNPHGIEQVIHVDAYRLSSADDLDALGWDRLFDAHTRQASGRSVAVIEWPRRIADALPAGPNLASIGIVSTGPHARRFTIEFPDAWSARPEVERLVDYPVVRCRVKGTWVEPLSPSWPFADEQARLADLYGWFSGTYQTSRDPEPEDER